MEPPGQVDAAQRHELDTRRGERDEVLRTSRGFRGSDQEVRRVGRALDRAGTAAEHDRVTREGRRHRPARVRHRPPGRRMAPRAGRVAGDELGERTGVLVR